MTQRTALCGTTAIFIALSGSAWAEVTGADVWANWKSAAESVGQTLTPGSVDQSGDTLTISDLQIAMDMTDVKITGAIDEIAFRDNGDGTVAISMSPSYGLTIDADSDDAEDARVNLTVNQEGLAMVASGTPDAITYDLLASAIRVVLDDLVVEDEDVDITGEIALTDMDGKYVVSAGDMTQVMSDLRAARMTIVAAANEPGGDGTFTMNLDYADIAGSTEGSLMMMADPTAISQALADGMNTASSMTHGAASFDVDFKDGSDVFALEGTADTGTFDVAMNADALSYAVSNTGLAFAMSGSEIPLPEIAAVFGEIGFTFLMPVAASEEPGDFGIGITLRDLSVSDMIWSMIDGGGQLPHDPATLIIEVAGKANWLFDIFDPDSVDVMDSEMPAELHSLDIKALQLTLAGAELTGTGGFTFNMDDLESFDGLPAPTGAVDLKLVGGNGLMDSLVAMGLLPEEQAMGARMMLGLFARPGDGEDTLTSKIEVDGDTGAISANGQRLQ